MAAPQHQKLKPLPGADPIHIPLNSPTVPTMGRNHCCSDISLHKQQQQQQPGGVQNADHISPKNNSLKLMSRKRKSRAIPDLESITGDSVISTGGRPIHPLFGTNPIVEHDGDSGDQLGAGRRRKRPTEKSYQHHVGSVGRQLFSQAQSTSSPSMKRAKTGPSPTSPRSQHIIRRKKTSTATLLSPKKGKRRAVGEPQSVQSSQPLYDSPETGGIEEYMGFASNQAMHDHEQDIDMQLLSCTTMLDHTLQDHTFITTHNDLQHTTSHTQDAANNQIISSMQDPHMGILLGTQQQPQNQQHQVPSGSPSPTDSLESDESSTDSMGSEASIFGSAAYAAKYLKSSAALNNGMDNEDDLTFFGELLFA